MKEEYRIRIKAVRRFLAGERPAVKIYRSLNQSRRWFYFWINRYNSNDQNWHKDKPKAPRIIHNKTAKETETLVCNVR